MNFETKHEVHNGVFSTQIFFTAYGEAEMDAAHEEALFEDLGLPKINLGEMVFEGKFGVDTDLRVVADEEGDEIKIIVNSKTLTVGPGFVASYSADSADVPASEIGEKINSKKLVAEAKCVLFENTIKNKIKEVISAAKAEKTRFETADIASLIV